MAKLVFGVHGLRGSLNNSLALAKRLVALGHDVTFVAFRDVEADVHSVGARFVRLSDGPDAADALAASIRSRGLIRSLMPALRSRRELLRLTQARRLLRALAPDLAIIDMEMHGLVLAARSEATPTLLAIPWHDVFHDAERPPMHTELVPASTALQTLRIRLAWHRTFLGRRVQRVVWPLTRAGLAARLLPFQLNTAELVNIRAMAANLHIDLDEIADEKHWMKPLVYTHAPVLSFTSRRLELDPDAPHGVVHVGPMIDPDRRVRGETSARVDRFIADASRNGRSIAYCSMGSLQPASRAYYRIVVEALAGLDDWALIIGLGGQGAEVELGESGSHVLLLDDAPQLQILEQARVAIHPGGTGTFYECVQSGVPSVVIHTGHVDMPGIAARVDYHHLGRAIDRDVVTPELLAATIREITTSSTIGESLARHRGHLREYVDRAVAVQLVTEALERRARPRNG